MAQVIKPLHQILLGVFILLMSNYLYDNNVGIYLWAMAPLREIFMFAASKTAHQRSQFSKSVTSGVSKTQVSCKGQGLTSHWAV
jgi:hypothetical protein